MTQCRDERGPPTPWSLRDQLAKPVGSSPTMVGPAYPMLWDARYSSQRHQCRQLRDPCSNGQPENDVYHDFILLRTVGRLRQYGAVGNVAVRQRAVDTRIQYRRYWRRRRRVSRRYRVCERHDGAGRLVEQFERRLGHDDELEQRTTDRQPRERRSGADGACTPRQVNTRRFPGACCQCRGCRAQREAGRQSPRASTTRLFSSGRGANITVTLVDRHVSTFASSTCARRSTSRAAR